MTKRLVPGLYSEVMRTDRRYRSIEALDSKSITPLLHHSSTPILLGFDAVILCILTRNEVIATQGNFGFCFIFWSPGA